MYGTRRVRRRFVITQKPLSFFPREALGPRGYDAAAKPLVPRFFTRAFGIDPFFGTFPLPRRRFFDVFLASTRQFRAR